MEAKIPIVCVSIKNDEDKKPLNFNYKEINQIK